MNADNKGRSYGPNPKAIAGHLVVILKEPRVSKKDLLHTWRKHNSATNRHQPHRWVGHAFSFWPLAMDLVDHQHQELQLHRFG